MTKEHWKQSHEKGWDKKKKRKKENGKQSHKEEWNRKGTEKTERECGSENANVCKALVV